MQQLSGSFPALQVSASIAANIKDDFVGGWSSGSSNLVRIPAQPTIVKPWTVVAWSIQCNGFLLNLHPGIAPNGLLGKLYAGPILGASGYAPLNGPTFPTYQGIQPQALPYAELIWDGSSAPPFPWITVNDIPSLAKGALAASFALPVPQPLGPGDTLGMGLWLTPSLGASNPSVLICNASYSVSYDYA